MVLYYGKWSQNNNVSICYISLTFFPMRYYLFYYVFHLLISINIYDFATNGEDYQGHYKLNKRENDQVAKWGNSVILILNTTLYVVSFVYVEQN
jgi:hypothetical protein